MNTILIVIAGLALLPFALRGLGLLVWLLGSGIIKAYEAWEWHWATPEHRSRIRVMRALENYDRALSRRHQ